MEINVNKLTPREMAQEQLRKQQQARVDAALASWRPYFQSLKAQCAAEPK